MAKVLSLAALLALMVPAFDASAQTKTCPDGQYYDPDKRKCVTPRGSY